MSSHPASTPLLAAAKTNRWIQPLSRQQILSGSVFIIALTALLYVNSLRGGFILDDDLLLTDNELVKSPDGLDRIWLTSEAVDYWPVTNTSFWMEWRLWSS